jgi:hypothetical protein
VSLRVWKHEKRPSAGPNLAKGLDGAWATLSAQTTAAPLATPQEGGPPSFFDTVEVEQKGVRRHPSARCVEERSVAVRLNPGADLGRVLNETHLSKRPLKF